MEIDTTISRFFSYRDDFGNIDTALAELSRLDERCLVYPDGPRERKVGYIFRGELDYATPLQSSLEREVEGEIKDLQPVEQHCFFRFRDNGGVRVAKIIASQDNKWHVPPESEVFWWLSLMRHYGKPTRQIDFTRDIWQALFFAIEQREHEKAKGSQVRSDDLLIYCLPCRDLFTPEDDKSNKTPFRFTHGTPNLHDALGHQMELKWANNEESAMRYGVENRKQSWGWDLDFFQNPRIRAQQGMLVYPYGFPEKLQRDESWLIHNLAECSSESDPFNLGEFASQFRGLCLRIPGRLASNLEKHFGRQPNPMMPATVYVDFARVQIPKYRRSPS